MNEYGLVLLELGEVGTVLRLAAGIALLGFAMYSLELLLLFSSRNGAQLLWCQQVALRPQNFLNLPTCGISSSSANSACGIAASR